MAHFYSQSSDESHKPNREGASTEDGECISGVNCRRYSKGHKAVRMTDHVDYFVVVRGMIFLNLHLDDSLVLWL